MSLNRLAWVSLTRQPEREELLQAVTCRSLWSCVELPVNPVF
jgi:hypothetical protein